MWITCPEIFLCFPLWIILRLFRLILKVTHNLINNRFSFILQEKQAYSQIHRTYYEYGENLLYIYT